MLLSEALPGWYEGLKPKPELTVSEWADAKRVLNQRSSAESGAWRTSRAPFTKDIMDDLSVHSSVGEVSVMKGVQIAGTESGNNFIGYIIDHAPGPWMVVQPTVDMGKRWSRQRLGPMIEDMPCLSEKIKPSRSRDSGNTTLSKEFDGGLGIITGANSASGLRSMPAKYLMKDELDAWPIDVDKEGDPSEIVDARTTTFSRSKILNISTPTDKATSRIWRKYKEGDQRKYHVPCPHCKELQVLNLKSLVWEKDENGDADPDSVQAVCEHCGAMIPEYHKTWMLANGKWIPTGPRNDRHHSYHLPSYYSPLGWMSWADIVRKFIKSEKSRELLQVFTNLVDGLPFEDKTEHVDASYLQERAEAYALGKCYLGDLILTAGVDTQPDRFEIEVWAHGMNHSRVIDYQVIWGDPEDRETRSQLDDALALRYPHESGVELKIAAAGIDSGGHNTQTIYNFCRTRKRRQIFALKGYSQRWKPIIGKPTKVDVSVSGRTIKNGADLWMVGSDTAKKHIYTRLAKTDPEKDGYIYLSKELNKEFFDGLTSERISTRYVKGFPVKEFVKDPSVRNEPLDCAAYAICAYYKLGLNRWRAAQWKQLEEKVQPVTKDLFAEADGDEGAPADPEEPPRTATKKSKSIRKRRRVGRGGFVNAGMSGGTGV